MEENTNQSNVNSNREADIQMDIKNLKPFLSVFIILVIVIFGYYFFWRSIAIKMKNAVVKYMNDYQYESIKISGFPFSKNITINNLAFSGGNLQFATQNQIFVKQIKISSFILSGNLDIKLKDISVLNSSDNSTYTFTYNQDPIFNIGFYSNGKIKNVKYVDYGYKIVDSNNNVIYTSDKNEINITSLTNADRIDYSIIGSLQNMKDLSVQSTKNEISIDENKNLYSINFDISSSIIDSNKDTESSIIQVNSFDVSDGDMGISATGEIVKDISDPYSYGNLKIVLTNYPKLLATYKKNTEDVLNTELNGLSLSDKDLYKNITNQIFSALNDVIKNNPETNDTTGILEIRRSKGSKDYLLNNENLSSLIQKIVLANQ